MNEKSKPSWWLLDGVVAGTLLGLVAVQWAVPSPLVRQLLQVAAVVLGYGLMVLWLRANASALDTEQWQREKDNNTT